MRTLILELAVLMVFAIANLVLGHWLMAISLALMMMTLAGCWGARTTPPATRPKR